MGYKGWGRRRKEWLRQEATEKQLRATLVDLHEANRSRSFFSVASWRQHAFLLHPPPLYPVYLAHNSNKGRRATIPTGVPVDVFCTGDRTANSATTVHFLREDRQNWPRGKCSEYDEAIQLRVNPSPPHQTTRKGVQVCKRRRADNFRCNDGVKRNHPFGTNSYIKLIY